MTKAEKLAVVEELKEIFSDSKVFYVTDCSTLTVAQTNDLRGICHEKGVQLKVVKNTLVRKALEQVTDNDYEELYGALVGPTALMFAETGNVPAKIIKEFRESHERPLLKAAYIDSDVYVGDESIEDLANIKSKEELLGELIGLLQSPIRNVVGALQSGGHTLSGLLKTLGDRPE